MLWKEVCTMLLQAKLLDRIGLHWIEIYCQSYDQYNELTGLINMEGHFVSDNRGSEKASPVVS